MTAIKHVTYVSPREYNHKLADTLSSRLSTIFTPLTSLLDLYPKLSDPNFNTDLIIVDIEGFYEFSGVGIYDIVNTMSTLIKSTSYINDAGMTVKRRTVLAATADLNTTASTLKEVLSVDIKGIFPRGSDFSVDEKEQALRDLLNGQCHMPNKIQSVLKPKKTNRPIPNQISLTTRQAQILALIKDKGASNKAIARILNITESTVKLHVTSILKKYGVRNRTQLAVSAQSK